MSPRSGVHRPRVSTLLAVVAVIALCLDAAWTTGIAHESPLSVSARFTRAGGSGVQAEVAVRASHGALPVHAGLFAGSIDPTQTGPVYVFSDPSYPTRYVSSADLLGLAQRIQEDFRELGASRDVRIVTAADLPGILSGPPRSVLLMVGGASVPDSVILGNGTPLLRSWVEGGGELVWAGGPLAFYDGRPLPTSGRLSDDDLGWQGEVRFFGYPLEDPVGDPSIESRGGLYSNLSSPAAAALGLSYRGTMDGANVSQVVSHGGTVLGYVTAPTGGPTGPRTSVAYVPMGQGEVLYFGGALWANTVGSVPGADVALSTDIALLIGLSIVPMGGDGDWTDFVLPGGGSAQFALSVPRAPAGAFLMVDSVIEGNLLFLWYFQSGAAPRAAGSG